MRLASKREFTWKGMRQKQRGRLWRLSAAGLLVVVVLTLGVFVSGVVFASHNFSDVPTSAFYHNAVEWVFNRGITAGCAVGMYCPNDAVTRGTMAVFLQKEGQALTPTFFGSAASLGPLDTDATICKTVDFSVTGSPRTAVLEGEGSFIPDGAMGMSLRNVYSIDGGALWSNVGPTLQGSAEAAFHPFSIRDSSRLPLNVGVTYRFGIATERIWGTAGLSAGSNCEMHVTIVNRNADSSPLSPSR